MNEAGNEVGRITVGLPDWDATRRDMVALRSRHGANSPIGHRCSNILEQLENYQKEPPGTTRLALRNLVERSTIELAALLAQR